jgi:hypothetical protein
MELTTSFIFKVCLACEKIYTNEEIRKCCGYTLVSHEFGTTTSYLKDIYNSKRSQLKKIYETYLNDAEGISIENLKEYDIILKDVSNFCKLLPDSRDKYFLEAFTNAVEKKWKRRYVLEKILTKFSDDMFNKLEKINDFFDQLHDKLDYENEILEVVH